MDFYVAAATVSPVLLLALAAYMRELNRTPPRLGQWLITLFVVGPAFIAIGFSLLALHKEASDSWQRPVVLFAIFAQMGASLAAVGRSMFLKSQS